MLFRDMSLAKRAGFVALLLVPAALMQAASPIIHGLYRRPTSPCMENVLPAAPKLYEDDKPDVPTAYGTVEAVAAVQPASCSRWYGVQVHSRMCAAISAQSHHEPNTTRIVAFGPPDLEAGMTVFLRHDHRTGRWHVMYKAKEATVYEIIEPLFERDSPPAPADRPRLPTPPTFRPTVPPAPPKADDTEDMPEEDAKPARKAGNTPGPAKIWFVATDAAQPEPGPVQRRYELIQAGSEVAVKP